MTLAKKNTGDSNMSLDEENSSLNDEKTVVGLSAIKKEHVDDDENEQKALNTLQSLQDKKIHEFIKREINNAILVENIGTEMTYSISNKIEDTKNYENFFHKLENNMNNLGRNI